MSQSSAHLDELMNSYSAALDEIYALRTQCAVEALAIGAHLELKSFPKSRREIAERQVENLSRCAMGEALEVYREDPETHKKWALRAVGASETLTRQEFEKQVQRRREGR